MFLDAVVRPVTAARFPGNGPVLTAYSDQELDSSRVRDGIISRFYVAGHVRSFSVPLEFRLESLPSRPVPSCSSFIQM